MFFGGITQNKGVQVCKDVHAANPDIKLFGPDGVAETPFTEKISDARAGEDVHHRPDARPEAVPAGRPEVLRRLQAEVRQGPRALRDLRLRGDEGRPADAIKNAGDKGNDRQAVIDAFFEIKDRDSVLGKYSIDENGDTTLTDYGANTRQGRQARVRQGHQGPDLQASAG